jgi:hypothetical protein
MRHAFDEASRRAPDILRRTLRSLAGHRGATRCGMGRDDGERQYQRQAQHPSHRVSPSLTVIFRRLPRHGNSSEALSGDMPQNTRGDPSPAPSIATRAGSRRLGTGPVSDALFLEPAAVGDRGCIGAGRNFRARLRRQQRGALVFEDDAILQKYQLLKMDQLGQ